MLFNHARDCQVGQERTGQSFEQRSLEAVHGGDPEVKLRVGVDIETFLGVPSDGAFHFGVDMLFTRWCVGVDSCV
jgi:hypothetical protein